MTLYQKIIAVFGILRNSIDQKASGSAVAPEFDVTASYSPGECVIYNSLLYRCTAAHSGIWNDAHFTRDSMNDVVDRRIGSALPYDMVVSSSSQGQDVQLQNRNVTVVDASNFTSTVPVVLPEVSAGKACDTILRITNGTASKTVSINAAIGGSDDSVFLCSTSNWTSLTGDPVDIFTFTYVGKDATGSSERNMWLVGRASYTIPLD